MAIELARTHTIRSNPRHFCSRVKYLQQEQTQRANANNNNEISQITK